MSEAVWNTIARAIGESIGHTMVEAADVFTPKVNELLRSDTRVIRLNLIAFCLFAADWRLLDRIDDSDQFYLFNDIIYRAAAEKADVHDKTNLVFDMFRNRRLGYANALRDAEKRQATTTITNYFMACCSIDLVQIDYESIQPNPDDLQYMLDQGFVKDEVAAKKWIDKIRSQSNPAIYSMMTEPKSTVHNYLMGIMDSIREYIDSLRND